MNAATVITLYAGTVISFISMVLVPAVLRRRAQARSSDKTNLVSWEAITARLEKERDRLQARLDQEDARHAEDIRRRESEWQAKIDQLNARLVQQQVEIDTLYRRLGQAK